MPLSHILAPQIAQKAKELEEQMPSSYLQAQRTKTAAPVPVADAAQGNVVEKRETDKGSIYGIYPGSAPPAVTEAARGRSVREFDSPRGPIYQIKPDYTIRRAPDDPKSKKGYLAIKDVPMYDPATPSGAAIQALATLPQEPGWQAFRKGAQTGVGKPSARELPNAPVAAPKGEAKKNKKGQLVIDAKPGEPIGSTEAGQAVDIRGKKLGYLDQRALITPYGDIPMRGAERGAEDVSMQDRDKFAQAAIEKMYGKHLKEVEDNNGKFPAGYFKGMKPEEKENIKRGVAELMKRRKGREAET